MANLIEGDPDTSTQAALVPPRPEVQERTSLLNEVSFVRHGAAVLQEDASGLHHRVRKDELDDRTTRVALREPIQLLSELGDKWGLSWALIARLCRVSPTAVRKWRRGESTTPENRRSLARLLAILEMLERYGSPIGDPASWFEMAVSDQATLTPADLYVARRDDLLFDLACENRTAHQVLDALDPNWRESYTPDERFNVVAGADGMPMIVERTD